MQELTGPNAATYHTQVVQSPVREPVSRVTGAANGSAAGNSTDWRAASKPAAPVKPAQAEDGSTDQKIAKDPYPLTGPTPAFQANVLDVDNDVRSTLARIEVTRQKARHDEVFGESGRQDSPAPPEKDVAKAVPDQKPNAGELPTSPFATLGSGDTGMKAG